MGFRNALVRAIAAVVVASAIAALGVLLAFRLLDSPPSGERAGGTIPGISRDAGGAFILTVKPGESASSVGERLEAAGVIRSSILWRLLARLDTEQVKSGTYRVDASLGTLGIRDLLVSGRQLLVKVTVPEGFTAKKIAALLEEAGIVEAASFLSAVRDQGLLQAYKIPGRSFEGYLYPDTYLFPKEFPADRVVRTMADNFFDQLSGLAPKPVSSYSPEEIFRKVVLASIVEREYRVDDEAPLMAGVFENRLRIGMALQSCATVVFVITDILGKPHPEVLYNKDIALPNPYNTYVNPGLPPGPISSPGKTALSAVFSPAPSDYLYFRLVDPSEGRHRFSRSLDEHVKAGVLYVKRVKAGQ